MAAAQNGPAFAGLRVACIDAELPRPQNRRFLSRIARFGEDAGLEAWKSAGAPRGERVGIFAAVGSMRANWTELEPALESQLSTGERSWERGLRRLHPLWMLQYLSNNVQALLAETMGARGDSAVFGGGVAAAEALNAAARSLLDGCIDAALVVAYDTWLDPEGMLDLCARDAAARNGSAGVVAAYDEAARGFVAGEGAAAVVLERVDTAGPRARLLMEALSGADGSPGEPEAATIGALVARMAHGAEVIDGAARAEPRLDAAERDVLAATFGASTPLTATSSALGHSGAARPLIQALTLAHCLERGVLPPIAGLEAPAPGPMRPLRQGEPTTARSGLCVSTSPPGLASVVRVELT
jgi:3-oxoacyl-[acyl-carrier-protein] synthase II